MQVNRPPPPLHRAGRRPQRHPKVGTDLRAVHVHPPHAPYHIRPPGNAKPLLGSSSPKGTDEILPQRRRGAECRLTILSGSAPTRDAEILWRITQVRTTARWHGHPDHRPPGNAEPQLGFSRPPRLRAKNRSDIPGLHSLRRLLVHPAPRLPSGVRPSRAAKADSPPNTFRITDTRTSLPPLGLFNSIPGSASRPRPLGGMLMVHISQPYRNTSELRPEIAEALCLLSLAHSGDRSNKSHPS